MRRRHAEAAPSSCETRCDALVQAGSRISESSRVREWKPELISVLISAMTLLLHLLPRSLALSRHESDNCSARPLSDNEA